MKEAFMVLIILFGIAITPGIAVLSWVLLTGLAAKLGLYFHGSK